MLKLPGNLSADRFLAYNWQKKPLFMPRALTKLRPAMTRNELAWLATFDDVESRIVFTQRKMNRTHYRVETGPFDEEYLRALPARDWTLLVHDVEKHLPALRRIFDLVPFIPDWRIDDLLVSFAAPGGGVGPHRDNYDVFLCQGIGVRQWLYTAAEVRADTRASEDLHLVEEFSGEQQVCVEGDILYLPPGIAHWGTAKRACITYSIGMRAPPYYSDPDLAAAEARAGYISAAALERAGDHASELGCDVTDLKDWLRPVEPGGDEVLRLMGSATRMATLQLHGMARLAFDDRHVYLNGLSRPMARSKFDAIASLCEHRRMDRDVVAALGEELQRWLLANGAFVIPEQA